MEGKPFNENKRTGFTDFAVGLGKAWHFKGCIWMDGWFGLGWLG